MAKKDFTNVCDFAKYKELFCYSPLSWTALSKFFSLSEPYNFFMKNIGISLKSIPSKSYAFKLITVEDKSQ